MIDTYDKYLKCVIKYLADHWMHPKVGIVSAGIFDSLHSPVLATSVQNKEGKWLHAESRALQKYKNKHGLPPRDAVIVVTLSPCIKTFSKSRVGSSCTSYLQKYEITRVHTGTLDQLQGINTIAEYGKYGLDLKVSQNRHCQVICQGLNNIFKEYGTRINYDLLAIKEELYHNIFQLSFTCT